MASNLKCRTDLLYQLHIWCHREVHLCVSAEGKCVQSSAQTEQATQMQGWMNAQ